MNKKQNTIIEVWNAHKQQMRYVSHDTEDACYALASYHTQDATHASLLIYDKNKKSLKTVSHYYQMTISDSLAIIDDLRSMPEHERFQQSVDLFGLTGRLSQIAQKSLSYFYDDLGMNKDGVELKAMLPHDALLQQENERLRAILAPFDAYIDNRALHAVRALSDIQWKMVTFYSGDDALYRRQAAEIFPLLAGVFATRYSLKTAIDNQDNLNSVIMASFGKKEDGTPYVTKGFLKRIMHKDWYQNGIPVDLLIRQLSETPVDWFPKNEEEWNDFCILSKTLGHILPLVTGNTIETLYQGSQGKWSALKERLCLSFSDSRPPEGLSDNSLAALENYIDRSLFKTVPRDKIEAAAHTLTQDLSTLPEGVDVADSQVFGQILNYGITRNHIIDWYVRMYAPPVSLETLQHISDTIESMITLFSDKVVLPLAMYSTGMKSSLINHETRLMAKDIASRILCHGLSAQALVEKAASFSTRASAMSAAGDALSDAERLKQEAEYQAISALELRSVIGLTETTQEWPQLMNPVRAPNGVIICALTTLNELKEEGFKGVNKDGSKGLDMCVGTGNHYANLCKNEGNHIITFRDTTEKPFKRLGCMQYGKVKPDSKEPLQEIQFRGEKNRSVSAKAQNAREWFEASVKNNVIQLNHEGILNFYAQQNERDTLQVLCGYDWSNEDNIKMSAEPWARFITKPYRTRSLEEFAQKHLSEIIHAINPSLNGPSY